MHPKQRGCLLQKRVTACSFACINSFHTGGYCKKAYIGELKSLGIGHNKLRHLRTGIIFTNRIYLRRAMIYGASHVALVSSAE